MRKRLLALAMGLVMTASVLAGCGAKAVSYTHLDVYKRQASIDDNSICVTKQSPPLVMILCYHRILQIATAYVKF